jgi:hypothetical protein
MKNKENVLAQCNAIQLGRINEVPFWSSIVTLVVFTPTREWYAAKSVSGKMALLVNKEKSDIFLCAWTGQYSTDIFPLEISDMDRLIKERNKK